MLGTLSKIYGKVIERRNKRYDNRRIPIVTVDKPVISVGNLLVGGTGKTPAVQMIARMLQSMGHRPAIVMRGYRRSSRGLRVVHDGKAICCSVREAGDEAMLHASVLNVPVVVCESKVDAAVHAAGFLPCDVIIVDDGFQHRSLHRDIDIVLVNRRTIDDARLLPVGRLREPLTSLDRADVILLTGDGINRTDVVAFCREDSLIARMQITATEVNLDGRRVVTMAGIADPERFVNTAKACGANIVDSITYPDHHAYVRTDIVKALQKAHSMNAAIVTTEKDRVKLDHAESMFAETGVDLIVLPIQALVVDRGAQRDVAQVEEQQDQRGGQPRVPDPVGSPGGATPQGTGPQRNEGHQRAGRCDRLGHHRRQPGVEGQADAGPEGHRHVQEHRHPGRRHMDVDDPVRIALLGVGRRHEEADVQPGDGEQGSQHGEQRHQFPGQWVKHVRRREAEQAETGTGGDR